MHRFLIDTEYATKGLFDLFGSEEELLARARLAMAYTREEQIRIDELLAQTRANPHLRHVQPFYELGATALRVKVTDLDASIARLQEEVTAKAVSVGAIAGALLQIARQAIVVGQQYGLRDPRVGRPVGSQPLRTVIWEGRNQAMHWDDRRPFHQPLTDCFERLVVDFGTRFALEPRRSLAKEVVDTLRWTSYEWYVFDVESLIG